MVEIFEQEAKINVITDQWLTFFMLTVINIKKLQKGEKSDVKCMVKIALSWNGTFLYQNNWWCKMHVLADQLISFFILQVINLKKLRKGEKNDV